MRLVARCSAVAVLVAVSMQSPGPPRPIRRRRARGAATVTISPEKVRPGDPLLVTVLGSEERPKGRVGKKPLAFFAVRGGHQAVFAVPIDRKPGELRSSSAAGCPPRSCRSSSTRSPRRM